ncbi:hypothetical protein EJ357_33640 [Streptomyces cyaneochromogenes]|uniref:DUF3558 domain-containing protein n=1 Tax=Streptomyces cyaneochromogenes TaxID=2496836 RepID=A0A3S9MFB0_9ACTN|nr:hypothetical protein [Streptomyces cyaneochromogenes]AZQ37796.1 hypothetical protein EJ357_33640 [Streptomyces cyaneochromogenes]
MDEQGNAVQSRKRSIYVLMAVVVLAAASAGGYVWWGSRSENATRQTATPPTLPATLCGTSISTKAVLQFHAKPVHEAYEREYFGGLNAPLTERSADGDGGQCALNIDDEVTTITSELDNELVGRQHIAQQVDKGGNSVEWGPARGYAYSGGSTELAVISTPCTLRNETSGERDYAIRVSVAAPGLHGSEQKIRKAREAMVELAADVTRYVTKHSAECLNADELPSTVPVLK